MPRIVTVELSQDEMEVVRRGLACYSEEEPGHDDVALAIMRAIEMFPDAGCYKITAQTTEFVGMMANSVQHGTEL